MPPMPKPLVVYERCKKLGLPLVSGGVLDQPYVWLQQIAVIDEQEMLFRLLEKRSKGNPNAP